MQTFDWKKTSVLFLSLLFLVGSFGLVVSAKTDLENGLVSYWRFEGDSAVDSYDDNDATSIDATTGVTGQVGNAYDYNGINQNITIPSSSGLNIEEGFSISTWVKPTDQAAPPKPILSKANYQLKEYDNQYIFQVIGGDENNWSYSHVQDLGRVSAMGVYTGKLFVGLNGGEIYSFDGSNWTSTGILDKGQAMSLVSYDGALYASTAGNSDSPVYKYTGSTWTAVGVRNYHRGLAVYDGKLYLANISNNSIHAFDGTSWSVSGDVGSTPMSFSVYKGKLYVSCANSDDVYVFDGESWTKSGGVGVKPIGLSTYKGKLYVACRDSNDVYVFDGSSWKKSGDVGTEPRGLVVYNGKLYLTHTAGNNDNIWVFDGNSWSVSGSAGNDPKHSAVYDGKLFIGHISSNDVYVYGSGKSVWADKGSDWDSLSAKITGSEISISVNGAEQGTASHNLTLDGNSYSLYMGQGYGSSIAGMNPGFGNRYNGKIDEVAIWDRALTSDQITELYNRSTNNRTYFNTPPDPALSGPSESEAGQQVSLDASGSAPATDPAIDSGGSITDYKWDYDSDGTYEDTTNSSSVNHTFQSEGTHTVKLQVVDDQGATNTVTNQIEVTTGSLSNFSVSASPQTLPGNGKATTDITLTLKDSYGNPLSGVTVTFKAEKGTLSQKEATSNSNGKATVSLTAPDKKCAASVTATTESGKTAATTVFFQDGNGPEVKDSDSGVIDNGESKGTVDATKEAGVEVEVRKKEAAKDEKLVVTAAQFTDNMTDKKALDPNPGGYLDLHVNDTNCLKGATVRFYLDSWPNEPRVKYWDEGEAKWLTPKVTEKNKEAGYVEVKINQETDPDCSELSGLPFAAGGLDVEYVQVEEPGWAMVSLPLRPEEKLPEKVFPGVDKGTIYHWNPVAKEGEGDYTTPAKGYEVEALHGTWIRTDQAEVFSVPGVYSGNVTITLKEPGWHQVGVPLDYGWSDIGVKQGEGEKTYTVATQASGPSSPHWMSRFIWDYDETYTAYEAGDSSFNLKKGKAYWVKTYEEEVKLTVPYQAPPPTPTAAGSKAKGIPMGTKEAKELDLPRPPAPPTGLNTGEFAVQVAPNPVTTSAPITFVASGEEVESIKVKVYDTSGKPIHASSRKSSRTYSWSPEASLTNGVYLYQVSAQKDTGKTVTETGKLLVLN